MYQCPDFSISYQPSDIFLPTSTMFLGEVVRDAHPYCMNLDNPLVTPFSTNPYQTSTSFSNSHNTCQQSLGGLSLHLSLFADTNGHPAFSTTADLFTTSHLLLPAHSEDLSYY